MFKRRSFIDDICFGGRSFDDFLATLNQLLELFIVSKSVSFTTSIFVQLRVDFLFHKASAQGIAADPEKLTAIAQIPFPTLKKDRHSFLGALNYYIADLFRI